MEEGSIRRKGTQRTGVLEGEEEEKQKTYKVTTKNLKRHFF